MTSEIGLVELLKKAGYPEKAINYYITKLNVGVIEGAEAVDSFTGLCGDSMRVYLKVEENTIKDAKFQAIGCAGAFASGSALTEIIKGKTLKQASKITEQDVIKHLEGLPGSKIHCARLAVDALRKSIDGYIEVHANKSGSHYLKEEASKLIYAKLNRKDVPIVTFGLARARLLIM
jgi:nitrogen fixation NifU-like protein